MPRKPRTVQQVRPASAPPLPPDEAVQAVAAVMRPAIRLLLHAGVDYPHFSALLKSLFIEQAVAALEQSGQGATDSSISLLSGVHRKDVRARRLTGQAAGAGKPVALSARVFAQWVADAQYTDGTGRPRALPRTGPAPSFETLVRTVTQDVHPFTVLQELIRLGIAQVEIRADAEWVAPAGADFVAPAGSREALDLLAANLADHASTAVANVLGGAPSLEQSVFASGITAASAERLHALARTLWTRTRAEIIEEALRLHAADQASPEARMRVRFGSYFRAAPWEPPPTAADPTPEDEQP